MHRLAPSRLRHALSPFLLFAAAAASLLALVFLLALPVRGEETGTDVPPVYLPMIGAQERTMIATGLWHTCGRNVGTGRLQCWGDNAAGRVGDGTTASIRTRPVNVAGWSGDVQAVGAGWAHSCALNQGGGVMCWGRSLLGQLGNGQGGIDFPSSTTAVQVLGLASGVVQLAVGQDHTCALMATGQLKCWGMNRQGEVGNGAIGDGQPGGKSYVSTPVDVTVFTGPIAAISAGDSVTCVLTTAGGVRCWGGNNMGQLGNGTLNNSLTPVTPTGLGSGVKAISIESFHGCAVMISGSVKCWGYNEYGQLGIPAGDPQTTPIDVPGLTGVVKVATGYNHICALMNSGGVKCWGSNFNGRLGDGTTTDRHTPADVTGLTSGVLDIEASEHTCVVTATLGVRCWGSNFSGQLGDGTTTNRLVPVDVVFTGP